MEEKTKKENKLRTQDTVYKNNFKFSMIDPEYTREYRNESYLHPARNIL